MTLILEQKLKEIKNQTKGVVKELPQGIHPSMAEAHRQRERSARERLKVLMPEYAVELAKTTTFILALGEHAEEYATIAKTDADCFAFNLETYYDDIVNRINPLNYVGKNYSPFIVGLINSALSDIGIDLDMINSIPAVVFENQYAQTIKDRVTFKDIVKKVVNERIGGEFCALYAVRQIAERAVDADFSGNFFPLIVYSKDTSLIGIEGDLKKIGQYSFAVFSGKESEKNSDSYFDSVSNPDKMSVIASLKKIRATIKKTKETK